jgi:hypothetical protein
MVILVIILAYMVAGVLFATIFVTRLIHVIDETTTGSPWSFRLVIFPGCVIFWPLLAKKYLKARNSIKND